MRHPVAVFAVLAYALSWLCWLPLLADRQNVVGWSASSYLHLLGGLGPALAAVVVTAAVAGRTGVADLLRHTVAWRGRLRWIVLAVAGPLVLFGIAVLVARAVEGTWPDLARFGASTEYPALPLVVFWLVNLVFYGFGGLTRGVRHRHHHTHHHVAHPDRDGCRDHRRERGGDTGPVASGVGSDGPSGSVLTGARSGAWPFPCAPSPSRSPY